MIPLSEMTFAEKYRPTSLSDIVGQSKTISIVQKMINANSLRSMIFHGPPGCGKTTIARIIAEQSNMPFVALNATNSSLTDIRKAIDSADGTILLYLDEIQYFNKKQQQSLLPYVESGAMILIASTTDNPYYCCYKALISRCYVIEFKPLKSEDIEKHLNKIISNESIDIDEKAINYIAHNSAGDVRRAINKLEIAVIQHETSESISVEEIKNLESTQMGTFDTDGDDHYGFKSALQKSIRGSDPNAAIFYLAKFLEAGDMLSPIRRLLIIANEDIGLANPMAVPFVHACCEMAKEVGLPEAKIPLSNAVIYLAISPKASTAERTYNPAAEDVKAGLGNVVPSHLAHAHTPSYKWPHAYPNHWVLQQYLPDDLTDRIYYTPGDNEFETKMARYWQQIMK